jgi:glyoxylase-like metal-dependent hydrolase (beta-lactamase superfamily II)
MGAGIDVIDTRMWGWDGVTTAFLVHGDAPALVDTGPQTSAATVMEALADRGVGSGDLAWIVLTHIHLDHCGASGDLARAFPEARVVVHPRGARHVAEPERLIAGSAAVYGEHFARYGGLEPVPAERVDAVADGARIRIGPQRELVAIEAPGHARHQHAFLDTATGAVFAGDALGLRFRGSELFPALPPPDIDMVAGRASVAAIAAREPTALGLGHFGGAGDPAAALARADELWATLAEAGTRGWKAGASAAAVGEALEAAWPAAATLGPRAYASLVELSWIDHTAEGVAGWAERQEDQPPDAAPSA